MGRCISGVAQQCQHDQLSRRPRRTSPVAGGKHTQSGDGRRAKLGYAILLAEGKKRSRLRLGGTALQVPRLAEVLAEPVARLPQQTEGLSEAVARKSKRKRFSPHD